MFDSSYSHYYLSKSPVSDIQYLMYYDAVQHVNSFIDYADNVDNLEELLKL